MKRAEKLPFSPFDAWRRRQGLTYGALGKKYGASQALAYAHCQPPGSRHFKRPRDKTLKRIVELAAGAITPNDFYEPIPEARAPAEARP